MMIKQAIERIKDGPLKKVSCCKRCGRILDNPASIERGYGYKCWKVVQHSRDMNYMDWDNRDIVFKTAYQLLEESKPLVKPFNKDDLFQQE